jgi:hypothetical protein
MKTHLKSALFILGSTVMGALTLVCISASLAPPMAAKTQSGTQDQYGAEHHEREEDLEVRIGLKIAPVSLNLEGKDIRLVGLGSYIVNAQSSCAACHSCPTYTPGHNPYLGQPKQFDPASYLAGGTPIGPVVSRNITPDESGKPAGLTEEQFKHVLRTGEDPDHPGQLLQLMVWPFLQSMTDHDIRAIYEYLRSIPSNPREDGPSSACTGVEQ